MQLLISMWEVTIAKMSNTKRQLGSWFWLCLGMMIHSQLKARNTGGSTALYFYRDFHCTTSFFYQEQLALHAVLWGLAGRGC